MKTKAPIETQEATSEFNLLIGREDEPVEEPEVAEEEVVEEEPEVVDDREEEDLVEDTEEPEETEKEPVKEEVPAGFVSKEDYDSLLARVTQLESGKETPKSAPDSSNNLVFSDVISDNEWQNILDDGDVSGLKTAFDRALNRAIEVGVAQSVSAAVRQSVYHVDTRRVVDDFWKNNSDLLPHRSEMQKMADQIQKQDPARSVNDILKDVEALARSRFGKQRKPANGQTKRPAMARSRATAKPQEKRELTEAESELKSLL